MTWRIVKNKYFIVVRSFVILMAIGIASAYMNERGVRWFPRYEKYVDNVVALMMVLPLVYWVLLPLSVAISPEK